MKRMGSMWRCTLTRQQQSRLSGNGAGAASHGASSPRRPWRSSSSSVRHERLRSCRLRGGHPAAMASRCAGAGPSIASLCALGEVSDAAQERSDGYR